MTDIQLRASRVVPKLILFLAAFCAQWGAEPAAMGELPVEVLAIRENAERLRSGEYTASGEYTVEFFHQQIEALNRRRQEGANSAKKRFHIDPEELRKAVEERRRRKSAQRDDEANARTPSADAPQDAPPEKRSRVYHEEIDCAFNYDTERLSFRRTRRLSEGEAGAYGTVRRAWFVATPEQTLLVRGHETPALDVAIHPPVSSMADASEFFQPVIDARSMGLGGFDSLGFSYSACFLATPDADQIRVADEGNGIRRLEFFHRAVGNTKTPGELVTWWVDEQQGFQPVRFVHKGQYRNPATPAERAYNRSAKVREEADFSWINIDGVWVVRTMQMRSVKPGRVDHLQLILDWKSINQPIAADHFDWRKWNLPEGTRVVDFRMGEDKPIKVYHEGVPEQAELPSPEPPGLAFGRKLLILASIVVLSVAVGWLAKRAWRARSGTPQE